MDEKKIVNVEGIIPLTRTEENQLKGGFGIVPSPQPLVAEAGGNIFCGKNSQNCYGSDWNFACGSNDGNCSSSCNCSDAPTSSAAPGGSVVP